MLRPGSSVRLRVTAVSVLVALVALALAAFGIRGIVADEAHERAQDDTRVWIEEFVASVRTDGSPVAVHLAEAAGHGGQIEWAAIRRDTGVVLGFYGSTVLELPRVWLDSQADWITTSSIVHSGQSLAYLATTVFDPVLRADVGVIALVPTLAVLRALSTVDPWLLAGPPVGALLVGLFAWWTMSRVLRPVAAIRVEMARISVGDLSRRVPVPRFRDEIHRLAVVTNQTLDRLEDAVTRHRSFVADAAHELRSPLAGLLNTLEVAHAHPERADLEQTLATALEEARRLRCLADDLLLLARLDRAVPPSQRMVDLDALVAEQVAERQFAASGPRFTLSTVDGQARVTGDEGQLGRLMSNLFDNAATHARSSVRITVVGRGREVAVEVCDDGPGVPVADRERVFDRFTRLDAARERDTGGAGLGLAIARDIASQHGGSVHIGDSEVGARFVVRLPMMAGERASVDPVLAFDPDPRPTRDAVPG